MPTPTDRTPQEWAEFCAREVMEWRWVETDTIRPAYWADFTGCRIASSLWSPYENPAAALEVLERLVVLATAEQEGPEPPSWTISRYKWGGRWENSVTLGVDKAHAPGDHFGPAVCLLAKQVMRAK